jgi:hypothetical protein
VADSYTLAVTMAGTAIHDPANGLKVRGYQSGQMGLAISGREYDHEAAESRHTEGETRTDSKLAEAEATITIKVEATSMATWITRMNALAALCDEEGYAVVVTVGGSTLHSWTNCSPANIRPVGGAWQHIGWCGPRFWQDVQITFRHSPVTAAGLTF